MQRSSISPPTPYVHDSFYGPSLEKPALDTCARGNQRLLVTAARTLQSLAERQRMGTLTTRQLGVLVAGCVVTLCWPALANRLNVFERDGMRSLGECWMVLWLAVVAGRAVRARTRNLPWPFGSSSASVSRSTSSDAFEPTSDAPCKILGSLDGSSTSVADVDPVVDDGEDDVSAQKRRAQAAQAAAVARSQRVVARALLHLRAVLAAAAASGAEEGQEEIDGGVSGAASALRCLAEAMLESPQVLTELLAAEHAMEHIAAAAQLAADQLTCASGGGGDTAAAAVLPTLLQASWVFVQLAHGPPAARRALAAARPARGLAAIASAAIAPVDAGADARGAVLRNAALAALLLVDAAPRAGGGDERVLDAVAAGAALREAGMFETLTRLVACESGSGAASVAAAALAAGALAALVEARGGAANAARAALADAALDALLQPEALHGVVYLTAVASQRRQQQQHVAAAPPPPPPLLDGVPCASRALSLLQSALARAAAARPAALIRGLVEERLVGALLRGAPPRVAQLLVAQLVGSGGQRVMEEVEGDWALDVPIALAQALVLPVHLRLPAAAVPAAVRQWGEQQQQHQEEQEGLTGEQQQQQASGASALLQQSSDVVHTDVLTARLLLQATRLQELVSAFGDESEALASTCPASDFEGPEGRACPAPGHPAPEVDATEALINLGRYLISRETELQRVKLVRGDSVADSSSISCNSADAAATQPHQHHSEITPASDDGEGDACVSAGAGTSAMCSGAGPVAFAFGPFEHRMSLDAYRRLRCSSKFVHSVLVRAGGGGNRSGGGCGEAGAAITAFRVPLLGDEGNWWALRWLQRWVESEAAAAASEVAALADLGLDLRQAALLWIASDFWHVDGLQVACEDALAAALSAAMPQQAGGGSCGGASSWVSFEALMGLVLGFCAQHSMSSGRLQRLAAQAFLRAACGGCGGAADACSDGCNGGGAPLWRAVRAAALVARYQATLLPAVHEELRDRLVALCVLNAGRQDADSPEEVVG